MAEALYDSDILLWSEQQAALLRRLASGERVNADVDWTNLIDEVESVGRAEFHAVESLLLQAMIHLLKLQAYPRSDPAGHWRQEARTFLSAARRRFSPSMRARLDVPGLYRDAVDAASAAHPEVALWDRDHCPFPLSDLLDRAGLVGSLLGVVE